MAVTEVSLRGLFGAVQGRHDDNGSLTLPLLAPPLQLFWRMS